MNTWMTWEEYKREAKAKDSDTKAILEEAEAKSEILTTIINRRYVVNKYTDSVFYGKMKREGVSYEK